MKSVVVNLSLFKAGWVAAILTAAASMPATGLMAVTGVVLVHLLRSESWQAETNLLLSAAVIGTAWETILMSTGVLSYNSGMLLNGLAPYWIVGMWVLFATTLNVGMKWLHRSIPVAAFAGAAGGPLSFVAGERAGAVTMNEPVIALATISIGWAILLPVLVKLANHFNGQVLPARSQAVSY